MDNFACYYIEANVVSIIILLILLFRTIKGIDRQLSQVEFIRTSICYILLFSVDIVWMCFESGAIKSTSFMTHSIYFVLFTVMSIASYQWLVYSEIIQGNTAVYKARKRLLLAIPFIVIFVLFFIYSLYLQLSGYIERIRYRLVLHRIMLFLSCGYALCASIKSFIRACSKKNNFYRGLFIHMGIYPLIFIIAIISQMIFSHIPILCFTCTLIMLCFYFTGIDRLISIDPLTKLNNRNQLNRYFHQLQRDDGTKLYLLIIDIDQFKSINDTYGHLEGDNALKLVADSFMQVCSNYKYRYFIARYGGDEFIIIVNAENKSEVEELKEKLENKVFLNSIKAKSPYELQVSIGFAKIKGKDSIEDSLYKADQELYKEKKSKYELREEIKSRKIKKLSKRLE